MLTTEQWALSHAISTAPIPPTVEDYNESCPLTARQIAVRTVVLQGVVAVAAGVDPEPVVEWFRDQGIWSNASPQEQLFLLDPAAANHEQQLRFQWRQEAEWALLWVVNKIGALGLPTRQCDAGRLVDEIIPPLGSNIEPFLASAVLQPPGKLLAEDDRHYNLWCRYFQDRHGGPDLLPSDLLFDVLYQRQYAFEWLHGVDDWDEVRCDA